MLLYSSGTQPWYIDDRNGWTIVYLRYTRKYCYKKHQIVDDSRPDAEEWSVLV